MSSVAKSERRAEIIDILAAVLIGLATVGGAICAYYAAIWGGNTNELAQKAIYQLTDSNKDYLEAAQNLSALQFNDFQEDYLYIEWQRANDLGDTDTARYLLSKMSIEGQAALTATSDSEAEANYQLYAEKLNQHVEAAENQAANAIATFETTKEMMNQSKIANDNGDRFTFTVVLFTIALFFGGITAVSKRTKLKLAYIAFSGIVFCASLITMLNIPFPS